MPGSTGARPTADEVLQRRNKALVLRQAGATWDEVARGAGYANRQNARQAVMKHLEEHAVENVHQLRALEGARLDRLQRTLWTRALGGDLDAIDRTLRIMDQRAKLLGLNAPTKIEITDEMDREIQQLAALMDDDGTWNITGIPEEAQADEP